MKKLTVKWKEYFWHHIAPPPSLHTVALYCPACGCGCTYMYMYTVRIIHVHVHVHVYVWYSISIQQHSIFISYSFTEYIIFPKKYFVVCVHCRLREVLPHEYCREKGIDQLINAVSCERERGGWEGGRGEGGREGEGRVRFHNKKFTHILLL